jgi:hypothetical protein
MLLFVASPASKKVVGKKIANKCGHYESENGSWNPEQLKVAGQNR